ncbi:MAG: NAD(+)--dinitrogen-reductase ADP-D-ribosyltransferase [Gammaproteobacteria bacterium]
MPNISTYGHSTNLIGLSAAYIASPDFNRQPRSLHIAGTRDAAAGLFELLNKQNDRAECGQIFQDYMNVVFGYEAEQRLRADRFGLRRYRNSYLRLIQDWGLDSNNAQGAVFKGWVESRFGLFPTYHKQHIDGFSGEAWIQYIEDKMNSRYHNNCIYMQLDLLYEFCQWVIERFHFPATAHKTLYRGVNALGDYCVAEKSGNDYKLVRFNSIVSFTDRDSIAGEFGAYVLEVQVPMVKVIFFNELLPHHALRGEAEYLVIGGDYRVKVLR